MDLGEMPPHATRVLRMVPWDGAEPVLAGTDLHLSDGGAEIADWCAGAGRVKGRVQTKWQVPVTVTAAFPDADSYRLATATVPPGGGAFEISRE